MSFVGANDHPNPDSPEDPLYYAPRSARSTADPRSTRDTADELRPFASRSAFVSF